MMFSSKTRIRLYRWRTPVSYITALFVAAALLGLALAAFPAIGLRLPPWVEITAGIVAAAALVLWVMLPAWHYTWFRYVAYALARALAWFWRWLTRGWGSALVLLGFVYVLQLIWGGPGQRLRVRDFLALWPWLRPGIVVAALALILWGARMRRSIFFSPFVDLTGDDKLKAAAQGITPRLINELARIAWLYSIIDRNQPTKKPVGINIHASVEDTSQVLQNLVGPDARIGWGTFSLPIGPIVAFVSRLVQGPRLTGSLQMEGGQPVLIAELSGAGMRGSWRISPRDLTVRDGVASDRETPPPSGTPGSEPVHALTDQLACRFFAFQGGAGSPRWEAVESYSEGLRAFRETIRTKRDRIVNLRKAEREFIHALEDDIDYAQCHYNLGIVYRDLNEHDSARAAFERAIEKDPKNWRAHLALAENRQIQGDPDSAVIHCSGAIRLKSNEPKAWNLRAVADADRRFRLLGKDARGAGMHPEVWNELIPDREIAAALAWQTFSGSAFQAEPDANDRKVAKTCLRSLGVALGMVRNPKCRAVFRQAMRIVPADDDLHFELGKSLLGQGDVRGAATEFRAALELEDRREYWCYLAQTLPASTPNDIEEIRKACSRALDRSSDLKDGNEWIARDLAGVYEKIGDTRQAKLTGSIPGFLSELELRPAEGLPAYLDRMEMLKRNSADWDWGAAMTQVEAAQHCLLEAGSDASRETRVRHAAEARVRALDAISGLGPNHPAEIRALGLHGLLARACEFEDKLPAAMTHAERAVALSPERAWERMVLAEVCAGLKGDERAEREYSIALSLEPDADALQGIAQTYLSRGALGRDRKKRRAAFEQVLVFLNQALTTVEGSHWTAPRSGALHYWLGQFHYELLHYEEAMSHLKIAFALGYTFSDPRLLMGWVYLEAKAYGEAEQFFRQTMTDLSGPTGKGSSGAGTDPVRSEAEDQRILETRIGTMLSWAFLNAERGTRPVKARGLGCQARALIPRLAGPDKKRQYLSAYYDCMGWIAVRKAELRNGRKAQLWDAVANFERSIALGAESGTYYRLARTCKLLATKLTDKEQSADCIARGRSACARATQTDLRGLYDRELSELNDELHRLESCS
jgi:tetratricopeptide (TPR) repeat protein